MSARAVLSALRTPRGATALALSTAAARAALGVVAIAAPSLPLRPWVGRVAAEEDAPRLLARALGGRDLALGLGALAALATGRPARGWILLGGLADAVDVTATVAHWSSLPRLGRLAVVGAAGSSVAAAVLAQRSTLVARSRS
jgi:hypothetical protein